MFGTYITVDHKLKRYKPTAAKREWFKEEIKPVSVMVIGQRTLSNGTLHHESYDDDSYFQAYLVVQDIKHKPFLVCKP